MKKLLSIILSILFVLIAFSSCGLTVTEIENASTTENTTQGIEESTTAAVTTTTELTEAVTQEHSTDVFHSTEKNTSVAEGKTEASTKAEIQTSAVFTTHIEDVTEKEKPETTNAPSPAVTTTEPSTQIKKKTCSIEIGCKTILDNFDDLDAAKKPFVPADGVILEKTEVEFEDGETVFDILKRVCKENSIQVESEFTPAYSSYYVEGIHQLYEFDCGDNSGWMYSVNGVFPHKSCSMYTLSDSDCIKFLYTCDMGDDLGAEM